jgi:integrase
VTLHEARHACITIWAQAIANPKRVQALAGHASITMTLQLLGWVAIAAKFAVDSRGLD